MQATCFIPDTGSCQSGPIQPTTIPFKNHSPRIPAYLREGNSDKRVILEGCLHGFLINTIRARRPQRRVGLQSEHSRFSHKV